MSLCRGLQSGCPSRQSVLYWKPVGGYQPHWEGGRLECSDATLAGIPLFLFYFMYIMFLFFILCFLFYIMLCFYYLYLLRICCYINMTMPVLISLSLSVSLSSLVQVQDVVPITSCDTAGSFLLLGCNNGSIYYIGTHSPITCMPFHIAIVNASVLSGLAFVVFLRHAEVSAADERQRPVGDGALPRPLQ